MKTNLSKWYSRFFYKHPADNIISYNNEAMIRLSLLKYCCVYIFIVAIEKVFSCMDSFFSGRFVDTVALAAVGAVGPTNSLLMCLGVVFSGGNTFIANKYASQNENEKLNNFQSLCIALNVLFGTAIAAAGLALLQPLTELICASSPELKEYVCLYLKIVFISVPFMLVGKILRSSLMVRGGEQTVKKVLAISGTVHTASMVLLTAIFRTGISGVAIAILLERMTTAFLSLYYLHRQNPDLKFVVPKNVVSETKELVRVSFPICQITFGTFVIRLVQTKAVSQYTGVAGLAVYTMINAITDIIRLFPDTIMRAVEFVCSSIAVEHCKKSIFVLARASVDLTYLICAPLLIIIFLLSPVLPQFFGIVNQDTIALGVKCIRLCLVSEFVIILPNLYAGFMRALANTKMASLTSVLTQFAKLPLQWFLVNKYGLEGLYIGEITASVFAIIILLAVMYVHAMSKGRKTPTIMDIMMLDPEFDSINTIYSFSVPRSFEGIEMVTRTVPQLMELQDDEALQTGICLESVMTYLLDESSVDDNKSDFFDIRASVKDDKIHLSVKEYSDRLCLTDFSETPMNDVNVKEFPMYIAEKISVDTRNRYSCGINCIDMVIPID